MSARDEHEERELLEQELSHEPTIPSRSATPPRTIASAQSSATRHRPGYARLPSVSLVEEESKVARSGRPEEVGTSQTARETAASHGLGISVESAQTGKARQVSIQSIPRVSFREQKAPDLRTPRSGDSFVSPPSTGGLSGSTRWSDSPYELDTAYGSPKPFAKQSTASLHSQASLQPSVYANSEAGLVSIRSKYNEWEPDHDCRTYRPVKRKWLPWTMLALAAFSTFFSGAYLVIALHGPRYGKTIHSHGPLTASSAAFLTSFLAKLIELTFVTVIVACIGQVLARRALRVNSGRGMTLAEISMRSWIMQPGTMITQWHSVRYAGMSLLGVIAIIGALCAILYTSAATALVQPQLKWPEWHPQIMAGLVKASFANPTYIESNCKTPIQSGYDPEYYSSTCIQMEHAAMAYHNYFSYLGNWTGLAGSGGGSSDPALRPLGYALLNDNTTVAAPWVERANVTTLYSQHGVIINNVSMAMPHPGIVQAAIDPNNNIMQPGDLDGLGTYNIRAALPSPVIHVLCATLTNAQLQPFVYQLWDNATTPVNMTIWPQQLSNVTDYDPYLGGTAFDDIFHWGPQYGSYNWPPVFGRLPLDYNTLVNDTQGLPWGRQTIYLLGKGGSTDSMGHSVDEDYGLCQLQVGVTSKCSTSYNASSNGGQLAAVCEDDNDTFAYSHHTPDAPSGNDTLSSDWPNFASQWIRSIALNDGAVDANGSNARLLTQLIVTQPYLNIALPSMAEALAVMAGCTLLSSAIDTPFVIGSWNYSRTILDEGQYQHFNALVRAQQYASGGTQPYQKAFYIILFAVFGMNCAALVYIVVYRGWYTDFSEPANLFTLAVNSPPSKELAGSCGGGPEGEQYNVGWRLNSESEHVFLESMQKPQVQNLTPDFRRRRLSEGLEVMMSPFQKARHRFSTWSRGGDGMYS